jgi:electron transport complex protein RnfB
MNPEADLYRRLQRHIDSMPIAFPATESGVEIRLLKRLFSPREAEIALALNVVLEPLGRIHRRLAATGITAEELRRSLNQMMVKGAINAGMVRRRGREELGYGKAPLVVGMFEFQVDRLTRELVEDFHAYMEEGFREAAFSGQNRQMRTVPINAEVGDPAAIGSYNDIRGHVRKAAGPFAVMNCVCRQAQELVGHFCTKSDTKETCMLIGSAAEGMHRLGHARLISRDRFLERLDHAEEVGLVLQPQNTRSPEFVCCCCSDCCEVLTNVSKLPRPVDYFATNYQARVNAESCTGCAICRKRCPMGAVVVADKLARVDPERCIGCGLCASTCEARAIRLYPRQRQSVPAANSDAMYRKILTERYGPLRTIFKAARIMTGGQV